MPIVANFHINGQSPVDSYNSIEELIKDDDYDKIYTLHCYSENFHELPKLPSKLEQLNCQGNNLTKLPELPDTLTRLNCANNQLTEIPKLPKNIYYFNCSDNKLKMIPDIPESMTFLTFDNNNVTELPNLPERRRMIEYDYENNHVKDGYLHISYSDNPIYDEIQQYRNLTNIELYRLQKRRVSRKAVNKISKWFLDCKYNPKYKYCRDRLEKEYKETYVN